MPVIKRYPNRKLYDTEAKRYITLEGIATLIRDGEDLQVVDHTTGEDLTALTLSQIIFEQQKKHAGFLPYSVLTGLIQAGGDTLHTLRRHLASSLGLGRLVEEEIERRVRLLVERGELDQAEAQRLEEKLLTPEPRDQNGPRPEARDLEQLLTGRGIPTRHDFRRVAEQLDALERKIEELSQDNE
jgi:polyhydroxyalkanoate synthesis repressor PhaR